MSMLKEVWRLVQHLRKRTKRYFFYMLLPIPVSLILSLLQAYIPKMILSIPSPEEIGSALVFLAVLAVCVVMLTMISEILSVKQSVISRTLRMDTLDDIYRMAIDRPYQKFFIDGEKAIYTEAISHISEEDCVIMRAPGAFFGFITAVVSLLVYLAFIVKIHPVLILVIVAAASVQLVYAQSLQSFRKRINDERAQSDLKFRYYCKLAVSEVASKDLRIFSLNPYVKARLQDAFDAIGSAYRKLSLRSFLSAGLTVLLTLVRDYLAYIFLLAQVLGGTMTVADFVFLITLVRATSELADRLTEQVSKMHENLNSTQIMNSLFDSIEAMDSDARTMADRKAQMKRSEEIEHALQTESLKIVFDHVSYRYGEDSAYVLEDLSFEIEANSKIALVGYNGAGKTTIVGLVLGLLHPSSGTVTVGGLEPSQLSDEERCHIFGTVLQTNSLMPVTCAQFVSLKAEPNAEDRRRIDQLLEKLDLKSRFEEESDGIDSYLLPAYTGDGVNLSGGEAQRLIMASVLFQDAPILLLDEPTAALDPLAEKKIYELYADELDKKTSIFISHRLGSTAFCDQILFLDGGKIVERGCHDDLLRLNGKYAELYRTQANYYNEEI
ncbi:MAG: ABC transporter ATP-binding protein [Eubacteriales bacterium]|nr:ABC transporter ATP-binding protein [Eubacteriales bacterium]